MAFCGQCGTTIEDGCKFCISCGTPVLSTRDTATQQDKEPAVSPATDVEFNTTVVNQPAYGRVHPEQLPEDYLVDGRYRIERKLGQGGMGAVYLAYDQEMELQKALKVIPEVITHDLESMNQLKSEAKLMHRLNHPNIVRVYDFHASGDIKYIDMEYIEGEALSHRKLHTENKRLPEAEVIGYAKQIAAAMASAHQQNILHRDLKPANIMLDGQGQIKLMDFGIAESLHTSLSRLSNTGSSGTLPYMSPEQARGKEVGKESDIYSYGVTLYELLSGHPPFWRGDIYQQLQNEHPEPLDLISSWLNNHIQQCLHKEYRERIAGFELVLVSLESGRKQLATPTPKPPPQPAPPKKQPPAIVKSPPPNKVKPAQVVVPRVKFKIEEHFIWYGGLALLLVVVLVVSGVWRLVDLRPTITLAESMVSIPAGCLQMGSHNGRTDEKPVHRVCVDAFKMGQYEVTQGQWQAVMGSNPSRFKQGDNYPVEIVSWDDIQAFLKKLNQQSGGNYRLPSEAEWEYAARGGTTTQYWWGDDIGSSRANCDGCGGLWDNDKTLPVGSFSANGYGLYDTAGNVSEWTQDCWNDSYNGAPNDGSAWQSGECDRRVLRGGSWDNYPNRLRSAARSRSITGYRGSNFGFRLVVQDAP